MTEPALVDRDRTAVDALVADRYLDALLAAADRRADDTPADAALELDVRAAATSLRRTLVRVHPSFRFEERLAARLADLAATGPTERRSRPGIVLPFSRRGPVGDLADPLLEAILAGEIDPSAAEAVRDHELADDDAPQRAPSPQSLRRVWLVGGAVTSAALSIAGVAYVAWRAGRASRSEGPGLAHGTTGGHA